MSDLHDDELRAALWRASGDDCDTAEAFAQVQHRLRRARRRRMDVVCVLAVAVILLILGIGARSASRAASERPGSDPMAAPTISSTATVPTTATPTTTATSAEPVADPPTEPPSDSAANSTTDAPIDTVADTTDPSIKASPPRTSASSPPPSSAERSPTRSPSSSPQTFRALGGSVTVATVDNALSLVSAVPNAGFTMGQPWVTPLRVQVEFRSANGASWIRIDLVNGRAVPTTGQSGGGDNRGSGRRPSQTTTTPVGPSDSTDSARPTVTSTHDSSASSTSIDWRSGYHRG
jgi:hypothetical protein